MSASPLSFAAWRARLGFSKSEAARRLGLSRNSIIDYEAGKARIPVHVALACAALAHGLPPIA
jgi:DNA-binding XRE family transcriptional regulator